MPGRKNQDQDDQRDQKRVTKDNVPSKPSKRKPRRGHGEGSVFRRKDGRYVARIRLEDGTRKEEYFKTEKEAIERKNQMLSELKQGVLATGPKQKLGDYLNQWLEEVHKPAVRLSTYIKYRKTMDRYIIPILGHIQLQGLTPQHVQRLYTQKRTAGLAPKTIQSIHGLLHKALDNAVRWNLVVRNVCDSVSPPRIERKEREPLTIEQARTLMETARGHRLEMVLLLAITTGMRRGELLGLKWIDIDFKNKRLQVRRTLDYYGGYGYIETEPKTAKGRRSIALPDFVVKRLQSYQTQQQSVQVKIGEAWEDLGYVFTGLQGGRFNPRYLMKLFPDLLKKAGLPHIHFHDLRHSAATILLSMGVDMKVIQELLGHSHFAMTADIYSHVSPAMQKAAMEKWEGELESDEEDVNLEEEDNGEEAD